MDDGQRATIAYEIKALGRLRHRYGTLTDAEYDAQLATLLDQIAGSAPPAVADHAALLAEADIIATEHFRRVAAGETEDYAVGLIARLAEALRTIEDVNAWWGQTTLSALREELLALRAASPAPGAGEAAYERGALRISCLEAITFETVGAAAEEICTRLVGEDWDDDDRAALEITMLDILGGAHE